MVTRRLSGWTAAVSAVVTLGALAAPPATADTSRTTVTALLAQLPVAAEQNAGYDRDLFRLWDTVDGCDTRERVLARQNLAPTGAGDCGAEAGRWLSAYDGVQTTNPSTFDIDHLVPLAEAWGSGAATWTSARREAYANDTTYRPALIAVSASSNRSKGDQDPAEWMPERAGYWCTYLRSWVGVKYRWHLSIDPVEKSFVASHLSHCRQAMSAPPLATIDAAAATPRPPVSPSSAPSGTTTPVRYANCTAARAAGVAPIVRSQDPSLYALNSFLDRDHDGVACE